MLSLLLAVALALFGAYAYYQFYLHPLAKYPGPPLAALTDFYHAYICSTMRRPEYIRAAHEKYGDIFRLGPNMLYINQADAISQIYRNKDFWKAERYKTLESRNNLFCTTDPKEYARRHRLVAPALSAKNMDRLEEDVTKPLIENWIAALRERLDEDPCGIIDFTDWADFIITDVIGAVCFGEAFGYIEQKEKHPGLHLVQNVSRCMSIVTAMPSLKWFLPFMISWRTLYKAFQYTSELERSIRKCVTKLDNGEMDEKSSICAMIRHNKGDDGDVLSVAELVDECTIFVIAGADTTSTATTNTLFYLAKHPDKQTRLIEEIRGAFDSIDEISSRKLASLPYLHAVLQEGMRIWPSATGHMERINHKEDTTICGHIVPKGSEIAVNVLYVNRDPTNFHDPLEFIPERWLNPDCKDNLAASQPMSVGPRQCIGQNLGWQEMRLILAHLLWNFELQPYDKILDNHDICVTWRGKIRMKVIPRVHKSGMPEKVIESLAV